MENKDFIFHPGKMKAIQKIISEDIIPRTSNDDISLENKLQQIANQSEFENQQYYIEIVENHHTPDPNQLIEAQIISGDNGVPIVPNHNVNNYDFMNFRVVRCQEDGSQITNDEDGDIEVGNDLLQVENGKDAQFILQNSNSLSGSFTAQNENHPENMENTQYVQVIERDSVPLVFFPKNSESGTQEKNIYKPDEVQCLHVERQSLPFVYFSEDSQAEVQNKTLNNKSQTHIKVESTIPKEVTESPKFRLYLYPCKYCSFKCNAIKELTAHKKDHHSARGKSRNSTKTSVNSSKKVVRSASPLFKAISIYCPVCDFSSMSKFLLKKHIADIHGIKTYDLNSKLK